jgi:DNA-binding MarR family transcriptional regulator
VSSTDGAADDHDVQAFLAAFDRFAQAVRRARGARAPSEGHALTLSQYGLLLPLAGQAEARIRELADAAGVTAPTATRIVDALERRGLVRRRPEPGDRRAVAVALTTEGRSLLATRDAWIRQRQRAFYDDLHDGERAIAQDLLRRLADLIDELAAGPAVPR